ncbi:MAG: hypothetical protein ACRDZW_01310 [Acidimicrobiales bacterium]
MSEHERRWVRAGLAYLAVSGVVMGLWATVGPSSFYRDFPGGGRHWVAGDGPFNAHLTGDAGAGFLALGVVLLLAAVWMDARLIQAASVATVVHDLPHLLYHLRHPNDALSSVDRVLITGGIGFGLVLALLLLAMVTPRVGVPERTGRGNLPGLSPARPAATSVEAWTETQTDERVEGGR